MAEEGLNFALFPSVGEIAQRQLCWVKPEAPISEAARLMHERGVSSVLIQRAGQVHVFTVEDLLHFTAAGRDGDVRVEGASHPVLRIGEDERVLAALEMLESRHERYLGVEDGAGELVGVVTYTDILASIDPSVLVERKTIGELIARNAVYTFTADWILEDVLCHLHRLEDAIIVVEARRPIGILTTKDLFRLVAAGSPLDVPLGSVMTTPVAATQLAATINEVLVLLKARQIKRAVVVDEAGEVVGVVTQSQLVGFAYGSWVNLIKYHASELRELVGILESKARAYEQEARTDPLTGLANRRQLQEQGGQEIERVRRYATSSFSMALIDIDFFKRINDTYGHLVGDRVLQELGERVSSLVRKTDLVVRWGGEEFAVLLPHTDAHAAAEFAERLCQHVAATPFHANIAVTISIGVSVYRGEESLQALFERVDSALYEAKRAGRNRVASA